MRRIIKVFFLPFNGISLILQPGLRRFAVIPLLINLLLYVGLGWLAYVYFDQLVTLYLPQEGIWTFLEWVLWPLAIFSFVLLAFYTFTIIANLLGSPFNGILAARTESYLTGRPPPEASDNLVSSTADSILGEFGKLFYFVLVSIPILVVFLVPGLNIIAPPLWMLASFWFLSIEYCDYPMGNHGIRPAAQRHRLRKKRVDSIAFGAGATVLMLTPLLQLAAMPALVAGATRYWVDHLQPTVSS